MSKLHRFFIEEDLKNKKVLFIDDTLILNQWKNVLRFKTGDHVILFDGNGNDFLFSIKEISRKSANLEFVEEHPILFKLKTDLHLIQSVIKKENFELILEKVTEIGISKIVPVLTERSVKLKLNLDRSRKILKEASEQSGKALLPEISKLQKIEDALKNREEGREYVVLDPRGIDFSLKDFEKEKVGVIIGPEGGFTENEIATFKSLNIKIVSLGKQILRSETAAISFTSLMQLGK